MSNKKKELQEKHNFHYAIVAVSDWQKGAIASAAGLDDNMLLSLTKEKIKLTEYPIVIKGLDALTTVKKIDADVSVELLFTNLKNGEPSASYCTAALQKGLHVLTSNKGPVALFFHELKELAEAQHLFFGFEGTVMSGTPVLKTILKNLAG